MHKIVLNQFPVRETGPIRKLWFVSLFWICHRGLFISSPRSWKNSLTGYFFASAGRATCVSLGRREGTVDRKCTLTAVTGLTASDLDVCVLLKLWPPDIAEYTHTSHPKIIKQDTGKGLWSSC